jgi:hypothetical protein
MAKAHFVVFLFWVSSAEGLSVFIRVPAAVVAEFAEVFEDFGVEDGRTDFVDAHGPFAEIDFAAAVTAEREVFVGHADEHAAGGAVEEFYGFFLCGHDRWV